jgi:hypothetical protein
MGFTIGFTRVRRTVFVAAASFAVVAGVTGVAAMDSNGSEQPAGASESIVADAGERLPGYPFPAISSVSR